MMDQDTTSTRLDLLSLLDNEELTDAQSKVTALIESGVVQLNERSLRELMFIRSYCSEGEHIFLRLCEMRKYAGTSPLKLFIEALKSLTLHEYHQKARQQQIGGGK